MDDADEVHHGFIGRSERLLTIRPCGDGLANHFRGGETPAASQARDALARFGVEAESEWGCHDEYLYRVSVTRFVIQANWDYGIGYSNGEARIGRRVAEVEGFERVGGIETVW